MAQPYVKDMLASGEVVLIETRQHWMAAIRFAVRPLVILLIGLGLLALNNLFSFNDDQFLSFINDLITWAVVILFLVAIVWLPIDLIRWDSRRYVLTNRRAMRVQGVLQKTSTDASIEQITDIGLVQTVLGRFFGYADLTLYTASDMSNQSYRQLIDGQQFKVAVLEAKNAVRGGGLLTSLPEGFVVKGGTNEASLRAEGKIDDEEPVAESEAPAESAPVVPEPAPVVPEPAPVVPEPAPVAPAPVAAASEPEPVAEPEPVVAPEPVAEPALVVEPEPEPAADDKADGESEPTSV